jgi:hypothetical protein
MIHVLKLSSKLFGSRHTIFPPLPPKILSPYLKARVIRTKTEGYQENNVILTKSIKGGKEDTKLSPYNAVLFCTVLWRTRLRQLLAQRVAKHGERDGGGGGGYPAEKSLKEVSRHTLKIPTSYLLQDRFRIESCYGNPQKPLQKLQ